MNRMKHKLVLLLALIVVPSVTDNRTVAVENDAVLYTAGKIYTMDGDPISPGQVLVVDGKIQAVGGNIDTEDASIKVVDLGEGSVLMPGLVDAYSQTALGDDGANEITDEITLEFQAIQAVDWDKPALQRQRDAGTTTMCVCPGSQNVFSGTSAIIKTSVGQDSILTEDGALVASMCNDPTSRNSSRSRPDSIYVRQPTNRMGVVWILRKTFQKANGSGSLNGIAAVNQVLEKQRPLMVVSRLSHDLNTVATLADEFGFSPIIVGGQEAYKVKEMLAERKFPVILQSIGTGATRGTENSELCWNQAEVLREAGVPFSLSGDNLLDQARFARRYGLGNNEALQAITSSPAAILGISDRVGAIAVGKDADLIAFDGEPLELTTSIRWVMVNGEIIDNQKED